MDFPTKDRPITINLTFTEFDVLSHCLHSTKGMLESIKELGVQRDEDQELVWMMIDGTLHTLLEQAKTSTQNLDLDRVEKELYHSGHVFAPYFAQTIARSGIQRVNLVLSQSERKH